MSTYIIRERGFTLRPDGKPAISGWSQSVLVKAREVVTFDTIERAKVWVEVQNKEVVNGLGYRHIQRFDILEADDFAAGLVDASDVLRRNPVTEPVPA